MTMLTCIAKITAQTSHKSTVKLELQKLLTPSRQETGCINYDMHVDNSNDSIFIFHENWVTEADLDNHLASQHVKACFSVINGLLESVEVNRVSRV
ncbi:putative quinol monooxygenase [Thalassotalea fusca]